MAFLKAIFVPWYTEIINYAPRVPSCFICQTHKGSARLPGEHFGLTVDKSLLTTPGRANYNYPTPRKCPNFCDAAVFEFASEAISK